MNIKKLYTNKILIKIKKKKKNSKNEAIFIIFVFFEVLINSF